MATAYDTRRSTRDVDAIFAPSREVREAADIVAERLGLEPGWLNDEAKAFAPGPDPSQSMVFEAEGALGGGGIAEVSARDEAPGITDRQRR